MIGIIHSVDDGIEGEERELRDRVCGEDLQFDDGRCGVLEAVAGRNDDGLVQAAGCNGIILKGDGLENLSDIIALERTHVLSGQLVEVEIFIETDPECVALHVHNTNSASVHVEDFADGIGGVIETETFTQTLISFIADTLAETGKVLSSSLHCTGDSSHVLERRSKKMRRV